MGKEYCFLHHDQEKCFDCRSMIEAGQMILESGICALAHVFKASFPLSKYHSSHAKQRLMQMPIAIRIGHPTSGSSEVMVMELTQAIDYEKVAFFECPM